MKKLNNKGFAISTVIYGTVILFIMMVAILLATMSSSLRLLDDRVNNVNEYEINVEGEEVGWIDVNEPDLTTGLIPVVYDADKKGVNGTGTGWFVVDPENKKGWYNYYNQIWANAVSVDSSTTAKREKYVKDGTYKVGVEIEKDDMLAMFVWIPRYSYTIGCTDESTCYGYKVDGALTPSKTSPGAIDIFFEKGIETKSLDLESEFPKYIYTSTETRESEIDNWYTHPAFTFGDDELSGIWVGKFETSVNPNSACYTKINDDNSFADTYCKAKKEEVTPRILPNVLSLVYQNVYNQYMTAKKFTSTTTSCESISCNNFYGLNGDAHMMKNSEWGAVAYLSQSKYGKYGNNDYIGKYKEIYSNQTIKTGFSSCGDTSENEWQYDEISIGYQFGACGAGASTTGNIYGIYDMSGGRYEYVMAFDTFYSTGDGEFGASGSSSNFSGFTNSTEPDSKYFDDYKSINIFAYSDKVIGHATAETEGWYGAANREPTHLVPWVERGGNESVSPVIFSTSISGGEDVDRPSFRVTLVNP